jgi:hypothetical protein
LYFLDENTSLVKEKPKTLKSQVEKDGSAKEVDKKKERESIKTLPQHNKENVASNNNHALPPTTPLSKNQQGHLQRTQTKERMSITSLEAVYTKSKTQLSTSILMKNTPTRDKFNGKVKNKTNTTLHHPYQRPPTRTSHNDSTISSSSSNTSLFNTSKRAPHIRPQPDNTWMDKQERGFVKWLNFVFSPYYDDEDLLKTTTIMEGPAVLTYRELACQRRQTILRGDLVRLTNTEAHRGMMEKVTKVH